MEPCLHHQILCVFLTSILGIFSGVYSQPELIDYFTSLERSCTDLESPLTLILSNDNHALFVSYNPTEQQWLFLDSNCLSKNAHIKNEADMANNVYRSFVRNKHTLFSTAIYGFESNKVSIDRCLTQWRAQPLHDVSAAKVILRDKRLTSWLHVAVQSGCLNIVSELLAVNETDVNANTIDNVTPLYLAIYLGSIAMIQLLLASQLYNVNEQLIVHDNAAALHLAVLFGLAEIADVLLKQADINVNLVTAEGSTALYLAVEQNNLEMIKKLLTYPGLNLHLRKDLRDAANTVASLLKTSVSTLITAVHIHH